MKSFAAAMCALGLALGMSVSAQDTKTTTTVKSSGGEAKAVSYTGCVGAGTEVKSYVLNKVMPVTTTTEAVGTSGRSTVIETSYMLVPAERVEIQQHVGHKVEVTGMLIPAGDVKTETTTKVERDDAKDTKSKVESKTENAMPQFRVTSIKDLNESCQ